MMNAQLPDGRFANLFKLLFSSFFSVPVRGEANANRAGGGSCSNWPKR